MLHYPASSMPSDAIFGRMGGVSKMTSLNSFMSAIGEPFEPLASAFPGVRDPFYRLHVPLRRLVRLLHYPRTYERDWVERLLLVERALGAVCRSQSNGCPTRTARRIRNTPFQAEPTAMTIHQKVQWCRLGGPHASLHSYSRFAVSPSGRCGQEMKPANGALLSIWPC